LNEDPSEHYFHSINYPQNYDWKSMKEIKLIEDDQSGLDEALYDTAELEEAYKWIFKNGVGLTILFVIVWPALSLPEGVFNKDYFSFWVFISVMWGFCAAAVIIVLPIYESWDEIKKVYVGFMSGTAAEKEGGVELGAKKPTAVAEDYGKIQLASTHTQNHDDHLQKIVPEWTDEKTCKRMAGHLFNQAAFDAVAQDMDGVKKISRADFIANKHEVA
jgi:hypothetical protein